MRSTGPAAFAVPADTPRRRRNDRRVTRALVTAVVIGAVVDLALIIAAVLLGGAGAIGGAVAGTLLALVITVPTVVTARLTRDLPPLAWAGAVMGGWLLKMLVLIVTLAVITDLEAVSRSWLGAALLAGALSSAVAEAWGLVRARPHLETVDPADSASPPARADDPA